MPRGRKVSSSGGRTAPAEAEEGGTVQRREEFRLPLRVTVRARMEKDESDGTAPWLLLQTVDLSAGGCRLRDPHRLLAAGAALAGALRLDDGEAGLACRLRVLSPRPSDLDAPPEWGARFEGLDESGRSRIRRRLHGAYRDARRNRWHVPGQLL